MIHVHHINLASQFNKKQDVTIDKKYFLCFIFMFILSRVSASLSIVCDIMQLKP